MRIIAGWHRAMCLCPVRAFILQRPASHSRRSVFHKWAPVLAGEWQATGPARIWEHWGPGSSRALTASAKPGDAPGKSYSIFPAAHSVPTVSLVHSSMRRRAGFKDWCVFHSNFLTPRRSRGAHPDWKRLLSFHSLFLDSFLSFLFFSVCPTDSLLICYLSPCPLSLHAPFVSFWANPFLFTPYIMANSDCGT